MKRAIVLAALVAAACSNKPTGFGVDVEARTDKLPAGIKSAIASARLLVSGAESFQKDIAGVAKAAQSGAFKFRYVPGVQSGAITIRVDALDGSGATIAGGTAPAVTLTAGKAVDAVLTLAINGNGVTCADGTDCISGNCVDGVCCDTACAGTCESCNVPGAVGACTASMSGTDPDNDCVAHVPVTMGGDDGGVDDDGGTSSVPPTGDNVQACAGTCDGNRACAYPPATTSCGSNICALTDTIGKFLCNGNGVCAEQDTKCTDFNCNGGACRTSCSQDSDCQPADFCNLNINQCVPKHVDGVACGMGNECKSGDCYSGVCCNTTCGDATQSCNNPGNVGKCQCTGHACPAGVACQLFYKDGDVDTFGDKTGTLTNGRAVAGCVGDAAPSGFVADNTDCDDGDANAHPGQTAFFTATSAGVHTFDYNCDGVIEKGVAEDVGGSCGFCFNNGSSCAHNPTCTTAGNTSTTGCLGLHIPQLICLQSGNGAYFNTINCGANANFINCNSCSVAGGGPNTTSTLTQQTCH